MKSTIRVTLSERTTVELLELMEALKIPNPTYAANTIITEMHKQIIRLSQNEETKSYEHSSNQ